MYKMDLEWTEIVQFRANPQELLREQPISGFGCLALPTAIVASTEQEINANRYRYIQVDDFQTREFKILYGIPFVTIESVERMLQPFLLHEVGIYNYIHVGSRQARAPEVSLAMVDPPAKLYDPGALANYAPGAQNDPSYNNGQHLTYPQRKKAPLAVVSLPAVKPPTKLYDPGALANYAPGVQNDPSYNNGQHLTYPQRAKLPGPVVRSSAAASDVPRPLANSAPNATSNTANGEVRSSSNWYKHRYDYERRPRAPANIIKKSEPAAPAPVIDLAIESPQSVAVDPAPVIDLTIDSSQSDPESSDMQA
jgi:hypothetical protein